MNTNGLSKNQTQEIKSLFELGAHLGHKKNRLHPKSRKYVYTLLNGVSIIDLVQTVTQLEKAKQVLSQAAKEEKFLLVVQTKKVASQFTAELCAKHNIYYITHKWLPGLLTNFDSIIKNVKKLQKMQEEKAAGDWDKFVKHERTSLTKKLSSLEKIYRGILGLTKLPDILLVSDIKREKNSINEAKKSRIRVVAIVDTNCNPDEVDYPVVANDDRPEVVQKILGELIEAYANNKPVTVTLSPKL